jgi:meromycolic acid (3R)-3-hydroxyacyl-[acyl-carrier protein] dehydratase HadB
VSVRAFDDVHAGDELPSLARVVTREDIKAYADASGDQNPLHQEEAVAKEAGFPGIIAHGMFTMGHMAAAVVEWAGDPAAVVAISAQFRAPVFMGERIQAGGRVRDVDPTDRTATVETWVSVEREGQTLWPVKKGEATVRLA